MRHLARVLLVSLCLATPGWAATVNIYSGYASSAVDRPYEASYSTLGAFGLGCSEMYNCGSFQSSSPFLTAGTANRQMDTVLGINEMGNYLNWQGQQYKVSGTLSFDGPVVAPLALGSLSVAAPFEMSGTLNLLNATTLAPLGEVTLTGVGWGHTVFDADGRPRWVSYSFSSGWGAWGVPTPIYYLPGMETFTLSLTDSNETPPITGIPSNGNSEAPVVPEPSTVLLVASGLAGLGLWRRMSAT